MMLRAAPYPLPEVFTKKTGTDLDLSNNKYSDGCKCKTQHINEDELKELFIKAANELFSEREEILANTKVMMEMVCETRRIHWTGICRIASQNRLKARIVQRGHSHFGEAGRYNLRVRCRDFEQPCAGSGCESKGRYCVQIQERI